MHIVILGNGIAGITAARHIRKQSDYQITVISEESTHFFSRTALMYIYMGHMRFEDTKPYENWFWKKNRIDLKQMRVEQIDFSEKILTGHTSDGESVSFSYDKLILATGSTPNKFGWPGQDLDGVGGLYHLQDLERMESYSKGLERAVIVGGGLIGIEMAEMFHTRHVPVTMLVREPSYWNNVLPPEESEMVNREIRLHDIDLRLQSELAEIQGEERVEGVRTKSGESIPCGYVGLTAGVRPNIDFLKDSSLHIEKGIVVDEYLQTNVPDVYAIGDCAQLQKPPVGRRPIEAVWYVGRMMGETVAQTICTQPTAYQPGIWFNSAKFFRIEYQVYGQVPAKLPEETATLYWEHPDGEKSIRINYDKSTQAVTGFNLMGIRYRHEVCNHWLAQRTDIKEVLHQLEAANFDPEFYRTYEAEVRTAFAAEITASL